MAPVALISVPALAGPPLATDDPAILGPGEWEVIVATSIASFNGGEIRQFPIADVSVGVLEDTLQLAATYQYVRSDDDLLGSESDFGNPQLGLTWRFWRNDDWQLALAPIVSFGITSELAELGIGDDTNVLQLPLLAELRLSEHWRLNTSVTYLAVDEDVDGWSYSGALTRRLGKWELMAELVGAANEDLDDAILDARAGFDLTVNERFHLLFAVATGLQEPSRAERLNYEVYFGLQFFY